MVVDAIHSTGCYEADREVDAESQFVGLGGQHRAQVEFSCFPPFSKGPAGEEQGRDAAHILQAARTLERGMQI